MQGITRAQAEEYVHKSEALLKEAGEFLKDAVKIVPPEETDGRDTAVMWDGSDVWLIPSMVSSRAAELENGSGDSKGKARQVPTYSRSEALLQRLKRDPEVIKVDPTSVEQTEDLFDKWHREHVLAKEGGMDHSEWFERIKATLNEKGEGEVLTKTRDSLGTSRNTKAIQLTIYLICFLCSTFEHGQPNVLDKIFLQGLPDRERRRETESSS